jgi:hypothetical protein
MITLSSPCLMTHNLRKYLFEYGMIFDGRDVYEDRELGVIFVKFTFSSNLYFQLQSSKYQEAI